jgi:putative transcriptional regulator
MSKIGRDLIEGMKNTLHYLEGKKEGVRKHVIRVPVSVDVKAIRRRLHLSQKRFADEYGFTLSAVRDWEQGRRRPERPTRILLKIIAYDPAIVERALG